MRQVSLPMALLLVGVTACRSGLERQYEFRGQVIAVNPARQEIVIAHDDIPGLMPAMTMVFAVRETSLLEERVPGDLVAGVMSVPDERPYALRLEKIGFAELSPPGGVPAAASGFELLRPGEPVPDVSFVDQDGRERQLSEWRGRPVALTFIYTRCPFAAFCPLMDRHFAALQDAIRQDERLSGRARLLSVSFDPTYDTPAILRRHAASVSADAAVWTFLTGDRDEIDRFATRLGVSIVRSETDPLDITHNLRTAIIGPDGALVAVFTGNEWSPEEALESLRAN